MALCEAVLSPSLTDLRNGNGGDIIRPTRCLDTAVTRVGDHDYCAAHAPFYQAIAPPAPTQVEATVGMVVQFAPQVPSYAGLIGTIHQVHDDSVSVAITWPDVTTGTYGRVLIRTALFAVLPIGMTAFTLDYSDHDEAAMAAKQASGVATTPAELVAHWIRTRFAQVELDEHCDYCRRLIDGHGLDLACLYAPDDHGAPKEFMRNGYRFALAPEPIDYDDHHPHETCAVCGNNLYHHGTEQDDTISCPPPEDLIYDELAAEWVSLQMYWRPLPVGWVAPS